MLDADSTSLGLNIELSGVAVNGAHLALYKDVEDRLTVKWLVGSGKVFINTKVAGQWGTEQKLWMQLNAGDSFNIKVQLGSQEQGGDKYVKLTAVNETTTVQKSLDYPFEPAGLKYLRSYGDGQVKIVEAKKRISTTQVPWVRTHGHCVNAQGGDVDFQGVSERMADNEACLAWCEGHNGTVACEWDYKGKLCTTHRNTTIVRGSGDDQEGRLCYTSPVKCSCTAVEEPVWKVLE